MYHKKLARSHIEPVIPILFDAVDTVEPEDDNDDEATGTVIRLAAKPYSNASAPSSRQYSTRKGAYESVFVTTEGIAGDYNHYRSTVLKNTTSRAVSIATTDILKLLQSHGFPVQEGDLGENILIHGLPYHYFRRNAIYGLDETVELQITEPMTPCANLCKLPYINDASKEPKERIAACQNILSLLGQAQGLRGWYARVLTEGVIHTNAVVTKL